MRITILLLLLMLSGCSYLITKPDIALEKSKISNNYELKGKIEVVPIFSYKIPGSQKKKQFCKVDSECARTALNQIREKFYTAEISIFKLKGDDDKQYDVINEEPQYMNMLEKNRATNIEYTVIIEFESKAEPAINLAFFTGFCSIITLGILPSYANYTVDWEITITDRSGENILHNTYSDSFSEWGSLFLIFAPEAHFSPFNQHQRTKEKYFEIFSNRLKEIGIPK